MYFSGRHDEVVYIMVSINIHVGKYMDSGHYIFDVLDYNTWTWWICDNVTVTNYSGYPENVYDDVSHENEQKRGIKYYEWIRYDCVNVIHKGRHYCIIENTRLVLGNKYSKILKISRRE